MELCDTHEVIELCMSYFDWVCVSFELVCGTVFLAEKILRKYKHGYHIENRPQNDLISSVHINNSYMHTHEKLQLNLGKHVLRRVTHR